MDHTSKPKNKGGNPNWKKGVSPNPGGRPKALVDLVAVARTHTEAAIKTLSEIAQHGENEGARVRAAEALLDRGWGKAPQVVEHTARDLSDDELERRVRRILLGEEPEAMVHDPGTIEAH